jgi:hypothetical protein
VLLFISRKPKKLLRINIKEIAVLGCLLANIWPYVLDAAVLYDGADTGGVTNDDVFTIDYDQDATQSELQFGGSSNYLRWDGGQFNISNDLDLSSNQIKSARMENVTAMPGGAGGLGLAATGRLVQLTSADAIAPGCTGPICQPGAYAWDGTIWRSLQGSITAANATRIVTVGPVDRDYTNIADAAAYLNTLSGGMMWIDPGNYPVTTAVDLENVMLRGADGNGMTVIQLSGDGKLLIKDTFIEELNIAVGAINATFGMDVKYNATYASSALFTKVSFSVSAGKYAIGSTAGTPPTTIINLQNCSEGAGDPGSFLGPQLSSGLNTGTSSITVINQLSTNPLKISDWPVTIIGGSNVVTSGAIIAVPDRTILVSPGMNIQGAINSLGAQGGVIKLLVGTHTINNSLTINDDNIQLTGEGLGTILSASPTWLGGISTDDAVIQVGASDGTSPRSNIVINNFQLQVGPNIHGIQVNGGTEVKVMDMTVSSIAPKTTGRVGILFTDGAASPSSRLTLTRSLITRDVATNRWVDGVHMDGDASFPGLYGYGNGITDSILSEVIVNEAAETSFAFSAVSASAVFSNRARDMGFNAGAIAMFFQNSNDVLIINNTIEGNNNATATGLRFNSNVDDSIVLGNTIRGGPQNFSIALYIANANCERNVLDDNIIVGANTRLTDAGTSTKIESNHVRSNNDPTVNDDNDDGYPIGTMWINLTTGNVFMLVDSTVGAAVWNALTGGGHAQNTDTGTTSNSFVLDTDNTGGDVYLQFGTTLNERLAWDSANGRFVLSDDLYLQGTLGIIEGGATPTFYTIFQGADQAADVTYTLPATQGGTNTYLNNDGAGNLTWKGVLTNLFTFLADATQLTWNNQPAALTEIVGTNRRIRVDLTNAIEARLSVNVTTAGANNAQLRVQYSTDQATWNYLDGGTGPSVGINATGLQVSSFVTLVSGARADVYLRVVGINGNNNADPRFSTIQLEVRN